LQSDGLGKSIPVDQPTLQMKRFPRSSRTRCNPDTIRRNKHPDNSLMAKLRQIVVAGLVFSLMPMIAQAAGITVTSTSDGGAGSLRQAMIDVPAGGVIDFNPAIFTPASHTITLTSELVVGKAVTVDASGLGSGVTLFGNNATRLISVTAAGNLTLKKLTLSEGNSVGAVANGFGGVIFNAGSASFEDCTFSDSEAVNYGGAVSSAGTLVVTRCTISNNKAGSLGGGIYSASSGNLSLTNSTVTGNLAILYGGGIYHTSPLTLTHTTITGNHANNKGGGIYNDFGSALTLRSSIVAGNTAPVDDNFFGEWTASPDNLTSGDPELTPLGDYGGPTQTMPPFPTSPAVNHGNDEGLATDQRGFSRLLATAPDIGAVEVAVGDYNPDGLSLYARVAPGDSAGHFEISTDPLFEPVVSTFAGTGDAGMLDATRLSAKFGYPAAAARDSLGNIFIADSGNHRIRMVDADGIVSTIAGSSSSGLANGTGPEAAFSLPSGIAVGPDDNVYVADTFNHRICKLVRPPVAGGLWSVETLAGPGEPGNSGYLDQPGSAARFNYPHGVALDGEGNVYVADTGNHRIRKITPLGGVSTYAGSGVMGLSNNANPLLARFNNPKDVIVAGGNVLVADTGNHSIRKIIPNIELAGAVSTFAGSATGASGYLNATGTAALFNTPSGLATDGVDLYVADEQNHRIRKIDGSAVVSLVAGTGVAGFGNGKATAAKFDTPTGLTVALDGNLVVADNHNQRLRRVVIKIPSITSATLLGDIDISGNQQVSAFLDAAALGLDPDGIYYFRWVSTSGLVTQDLGLGFVVYELPQVVTEDADNLIPTSASLHATVDPKSSPTKVVFEYSTDPDLLPPYQVSTLAGSVAAGISSASGIAPDGSGGVFVADRPNHRILRITAAGVVSTYAGSGVAGFLDANGTAAKFENPSGLAIDSTGNLYVADEFNHCIRMISPARDVITFAGSGVAGLGNGASAAALFLYPRGVAVDSTGSVYVADTGNHCIRKISAGAVETLAGTGVSGFTADGLNATAQFASPRGIAVDASGSKVLVADTGNHRIRLIFSGNVFALSGDGTAGFVDGEGAVARYSSPTGIALDDNGVGYVSDQGNHRIRRVESDGSVGTLAGSGIVGTVNTPAVGTGLYPATAAQFNTPGAITIDSTGGLLITEGGIVRKIARAAELPAISVTPNATGSGDRLVAAAIPQPLFPDTHYYFRAKGTNYRGTVVGDPLSFLTPQAAITAFAGSDTAAPGITHEQAASIEFGTTPKGQPATRFITIFNPGSYLLNVSSVSVPAGYQVTGGSGVIIPLGSLTFELTLSAASGGNFSGDVSITSDAPGQTVFTFPVTGVVLDPPLVTTLAATGLGAGTATLHGMVNPSGSATTVWFEYSTDAQFDGVTVGTAAGSSSGFANDTGTAAMFNLPSGLATDAGGNVYVADTLNHRIRKIAPDGASTTFAGTGLAGFANGPTTTAQFNEPVGIVIGTSGIIYVSDSKNHCIRAISTAGIVSTWCGLGTAGFTDGVPEAARFITPSGLALGSNGSLYVADRGNHRIRKIGPDGTAGTVAGTGIAGSTNGAAGVVQFSSPVGIAVDAVGNAFVTEAAGHAIRKVAPGGFTEVFAGSPVTSGSANALGTNARFSSPAGLAMAVDGTLYVADKGNHRIRAVSPAGAVTTFAGSGIQGVFDGSGESARFDSPFSLAITATGGLVVGEMTTSTVRRISSTQILVQAATGLGGSVSLPVQTVIPDIVASTIYYFRAIATNGGGTTISSFKSFGNSFQLWQTTNFGANAGNPLIAGASANPAKDGISNQIKYALGLNPHISATGGLPKVATVGDLLTLTYTKVLTAPDLVYNAQWSTDLDEWSPDEISEEILSDDGLIQLVRASILTPPSGGLFLRLKVTLQQP